MSYNKHSRRLPDPHEIRGRQFRVIVSFERSNMSAKISCGMGYPLALVPKSYSSVRDRTRIKRGGNRFRCLLQNHELSAS